MLSFYNLTDSDVEYIIENKEVPESVLTKSEKVLAIFTQDWCPDWRSVERDLKQNENTDDNICVALFIYNDTKYQEEFMQVKEGVWNNALIPYLRYYKNAKLIGETNHLPFQRILKVFNK